ncbi:MAG: peptide chain release factor 2 [Actinobacteria bacterium HGW-Actinobacteria-1]|jgi:peptide chain release factor 2|nr:MAG: peptide chain release factor 2 [Actinobacteria bacterium HGW-Actinobacteria-1]
MIEDRTQQIQAMRERVTRIGEYLHLDAKRAEVASLEELTMAPGFWDDPSSAQGVMSKAAELRDEITSFESIVADLDDFEVGNELAVAEDDEEMAAEAAATEQDLLRRINDLELASWFTGEFDHGDAIVTIIPGQGGLEAQDWAEMLMRMLTKYAERRKWKVDLHDAPAGVEIGIDRAVFTVHGRNAYGMLQSEVGVHRLVRISPTDEKKRRQTTFAKIEVLPVLPDEVQVEIREEDLRIDVYRSSGPGGQSVNTTDSAVRITHLPSGLVVTCQNEKSQLKNKESAMTILRSRLYELEEEKRLAELDALRGEKLDISFGSQIRNYVLYPYQMVKDVRSGVETSQVDRVLDGEIDEFIVGFHRWRVEHQTASAMGGGA